MVINNIASRYYNLQQKPNNHDTKTMAQWIFFKHFLNQEIDGEPTRNMMQHSGFSCQASTIAIYVDFPTEWAHRMGCP